VPGGFEVFSRARAALLSFDAALRQENDSVACILYVVSAESLTVPNTDWRRSRLTKRFIEFFVELMPKDIEEIISHQNFEETFGIKRGKRSARSLRRELLNVIYDYRSGHLHEGLVPSYRGLDVGFEEGNELRRALFCDFAERAILRYLDAPRCSLIGHPAFEPDTASADPVIAL
jgi:hypothetical protein